MPKVFGSNAARPCETTCMLSFQGGLPPFWLLKSHIFAPPQVRLQRGFSHCPGVHFQEHCGSEHLLSHCSEQIVSHFGGPQTVLHCGQSPCSQCIEGQTMAHFGGSHFWVQVARLMDPHAVSHCGGAQTGSQTSSQSASPQVHQHFGWQLSPCFLPPFRAAPPWPAAPPSFAKKEGFFGLVWLPASYCCVSSTPCARSPLSLARCHFALSLATSRLAAVRKDGVGAAEVTVAANRMAAAA
mmetsp:Transcript_34084/g.101265  ORF Transcript_34084/g.101265 Transcript_34084/m.101265 type:complete len:240 (-) Transcript_34084:74-793(-)